MRAESHLNCVQCGGRCGRRLGPRKTGLNPPVIVTCRPKAVLSLRFYLFYVWCCSVFKCFNFNTSVCPVCLVQ